MQPAPPVPSASYAHYYLAAVLGVGLLCLVWALLRPARQWAFRGLPLRPWYVPGLDFSILYCLLFSWWVVAAVVVMKIHPLAEDASADAQIWQTAAVGLLTYAGLLVLFLGYRLMLPFQQRVPLSQEHVSAPRALGTGLFLCLAGLPVLYGASMAWMGLLEFLTQHGLNLPVGQQELVGMFGDAKSGAAFASLVLMATVLAPVGEELVFRAGLYRFLKARMSPRGAMILSSAIFAAAHMNLSSAVALFLVGILLCLSYEVTGSLRVPVILHACFNLNTIIQIVLQRHGA